MTRAFVGLFLLVLGAMGMLSGILVMPAILCALIGSGLLALAVTADTDRYPDPERRRVR